VDTARRNRHATHRCARIINDDRLDGDDELYTQPTDRVGGTAADDDVGDDERSAVIAADATA
jgi:hypothetical protein